MFTKAWLVDVSERFGSTFGEAFVSTLVFAGAGVLQLSTLKAAGLAALSAGLAFLKGALASQVGNQGTAGLLPAPRPSRAAARAAPRKKAKHPRRR